MTQTEKAPSSVGSFGTTIVDEYNSRVRMAFHDKVIDTTERLTSILSDFDEKLTTAKVTRVAAKFLIASLQAEQLKQCAQEKGYTFEAEIPLTGRWTDHAIVYMGKNMENRTNVPAKKVQQVRGYQQEMLEKLQSNHKVISHTEIVDQCQERNPGYKFDFLRHDTLTASDIEGIVEVYKSSFNDYCFPLNPENVRKMIHDNNIVGVIRNLEGKIVSIGIGEFMTGHVDLKEIRIMEISDTATLKGYAGKGINKRIIAEIIKAAYDKHGSTVDIIFGEVRSANPAVMKLALDTQRRFFGNLPDAVSIHGTLDKEIDKEIEETVNENHYGDLSVMAIVNGDIKKFVGDTTL